MGWNLGGERLFANRREAGRELASHLQKYANRDDAVVLALPRGGVPVGYEVARALGAPLDVFVVRKLGVPGHRELAMGAIATGGVRVLNDEVVSWYDVPESLIDDITAEEQAELERRELAYRGTRPPLDVRGRMVLLIDDGLATGSTMKAAVAAIRAQHPSGIVVAAPIGAPESCAELSSIADEVICARRPVRFVAVGQWYEDFSETSDLEVRALLEDVSSRGLNRAEAESREPVGKSR